jgi:hypothetical protein
LILQFLPNPGIVALKDFLNDPSMQTLPNLKSVPALYDALCYELLEREGSVSEDTLELCKWLIKRAEEVLGWVIQHKVDAVEGFSTQTNDWLKVLKKKNSPWQVD